MLKSMTKRMTKESTKRTMKDKEDVAGDEEDPKIRKVRLGIGRARRSGAQPDSLGKNYCYYYYIVQSV